MARLRALIGRPQPHGSYARSASVGLSRAAFAAGYRPARAPIRKPAEGAAISAYSRHDERFVLGRRVDLRRAGADQQAEDAADRRQQRRLGQELEADVAAGRAERAAQADLAAALEHRDHHDVRDPDRADQQRHGAEPQQQRRELALGGGARLEHV